MSGQENQNGERGTIAMVVKEPDRPVGYIG